MELGQLGSLPMGGRKVWHLIYGGGFAVLLVLSVLAAATNAHTLWQEVMKGVRDILSLEGQTAACSGTGLPILLGMFAIFSILERVLPAAGPRKPLRGYWLNFKVTLFQVLIGPTLGGLIGASTIALSNRLGLGWIDLRFSTGHGMVDLVLAFLLSTFIFDFFFYWYHRFQHESLLWQEHKLHHMDEQLCAFYRESWLETLIAGPLSTIPLAILFKMNPSEGAITGAMFTAWVVFLHTNIRLHLGPFAVLFNGPQGHRIHHSRMRAHYDQNFAAFFPIWDVLFGTYHYPKRDEYPLTGVQGEKEVQTLLEAATLPFREWHKMFRTWRHRHDPFPA
jgi:sterol desaturase/sphingolipid hydroxylase (fatty acid hydroxylase superfamily)